MLKPKLFFLFLNVAVITLAHAQDIALTSPKDSVEYLVALAATKRESSPQQAEALIHRAHAHAVEARYVSGEGKALFELGKILGASNKNGEAINAFLKAGRLFESLNDSTRAGRAYNGAATVYIYKLYHYTKGLEYGKKAVAFLRHDSVYLPAALNGLAALHSNTGKLDDALLLYKQIYDAEKKHNNLKGMCVALNNVATVYDLKGDLQSSLFYYKKALEISRAREDEKQTAHILAGLAPIYSQLKDHGNAKQTLEELLALSAKHALFDKRVMALGCLAAESYHLGKKDKALAYALEAERVANQHGLQALKGSIYQQVSDIYKKTDNPAMALHYHEKYARFQDSVANQERLAVASLDLEKQEAKVSGKNAVDVPYPAHWMLALGAGIVIIGGMFVVTAVRKRKKEIAPVYAFVANPHALPDFSPSENIVRETHTESESSPSAPAIQHLEVINGEGMKLLPLTAIFWLQKEGKTYRAFTEKGDYRVRQKITDLEQALPKNVFFRINRAVIINIDQMNNYSFWENHKYIIRMRDARKSEFVISRSRLREMKAIFQVLERS